jgi:lipopolysaccharide/colanic/teichoic acid biosynthesis glycosyltransferase
VRRLARPLLYVGIFGIVFGLAKYHARYVGHYVFHTSERLPWTAAYAAMLCVCAYGAGLPDLDRRRSVWIASAGAALGGAVAISATQLALGSLLLPRFVVFTSVLLLTPWFAICVGIADISRARGEDRDRVVLVGGPDEQTSVGDDMKADLERPALLVATLRPQEAHAGDPRSKPLIETVVASKGTLIVLDRTAGLDETIVTQAATLHEAGLRVRSLSFFYDEWLGKLPLSELERMSLMFDVGELHRVRYGRVKRLIDISVGIVGLGLLIVATPVVVVGNLIANRGPLWFRQARVGRAQKTFEILKFRTMRPESAPSEWTAEDDSRVTPWGRALRRTHLDELPQVVNILRGEQSVVGPRPEQPRYVAELRDKIPFYDLRHIVRPGLTGWAQVKYRYGANELDALEKLQYDFYYLRHQSLSLDLRIIGRTLRSVAGGLGR